MQEWLLRGGRLRSAVAFGVSLAVVIGYSQFTLDGSAHAAYEGVTDGAVTAALLVALNRWTGWPKVESLSGISAPDRLAVFRAVFDGEPVADPRLAPRVIEFADTVEVGIRKDQRRSWVELFAVMALLVIATGETLAGLMPRAAVSWVAAVIVGCVGFFNRRARPRLLHKAQHASELAREQV